MPCDFFRRFGQEFSDLVLFSYHIVALSNSAPPDCRVAPPRCSGYRDIVTANRVFAAPPGRESALRLPVCLEGERKAGSDQHDLACGRGDRLVEPSRFVAEPPRERVVGDDAPSDFVRNEDQPAFEPADRGA